MASSEIKTLTMGGNTYALNDTAARTALNSKVDKVSGKGLSTNDYTTTEKNKLAATVLSVAVNGTTYTPDANGAVDLGTISGGSSSGGATTPQQLGIGYGECSTAAATAVKVVTISGYSFTSGSLICVKFSNAITASNASLNVNGTGAKYIRYKDAALPTTLIKAGDKAFFAAGSSYFHLMAIDRNITETATLNTSVSSLQTAMASTITSIKYNGNAIDPENHAVELNTYFDGDDAFPSDAYFTVDFSGNRRYEIRELDNGITTAWGINLNARNFNENYVLLVNAGTRDVAVSFRSLQYNGTVVDRTVLPENAITIPVGKAVELSYMVAPATSPYITGIVTISDTLVVTAS